MHYSTKVVSTVSSKDFLRMCTLSYMIKKNDSAYGREILRHIRGKSSAWTPSHGSLYPLLGEMVNKDMIYVHEEDLEANIKRYKTTDIGIEYYNSRVEEFKDSLRKTSEFFDNMASDLVTKTEGEAY